MGHPVYIKRVKRKLVLFWLTLALRSLPLSGQLIIVEADPLLKAFFKILLFLFPNE